ncbi:jupiter microtubule associated homolog 1 [Anopheles maculipalpis]|uniref:jupiter microtubule associated homolog 1 n=1 Tax=Anopheles maculipalpis TaxID=1496333 RepID=UPI002158F714|nr:jupiter microtubule associated homolog 1 [Anopheles maculipalpis]
MSSTNFNVGVAAESKPSSRVLKPPGGGHSDIFGATDVRQNPPRPKNNQQNSSNMNAVMGTMDPNETLDTTKRTTAGGDSAASSPAAAQNGSSSSNGASSGGEANKSASAASERARVPPGGHSQGFW